MRQRGEEVGCIKEHSSGLTLIVSSLGPTSPNHHSRPTHFRNLTTLLLD